MVFRFFPKTFNFFDLFEKQVSHAVDAACFFKEVVSRGYVSEEALSRMAAIEHQGDEVAHAIMAVKTRAIPRRDPLVIIALLWLVAGPPR